MSEEKEKKTSRRDFLKNGIRLGMGLSVLGAAGALLPGTIFTDTVWQLDPDKCVDCGRCAINCVLTPSAVKCVHAYAICGYCELCSGYFRPGTLTLNTGAENQICPTSAIKRTYVEDPYYEYVIEEELCIGCSKCTKGCNAFGNGSLFLQVRHDRCLNCNDCAIARECPADAYRRVPAENPYLLKKINTGEKDEET